MLPAAGNWLGNVLYFLRVKMHSAEALGDSLRQPENEEKRLRAIPNLYENIKIQIVIEF